MVTINKDESEEFKKTIVNSQQQLVYEKSNKDQQNGKQQQQRTMNKRISSAQSKDMNLDDQQFNRKKSNNVIKILQKIFPKLKILYLEKTLTECNDDILKTIETLIKESSSDENNSFTISENDSTTKSTNMPTVVDSENLKIKIPVEADFSEIRKKFGFNKKKPKNSFVRHKANYENAIREQAAKTAAILSKNSNSLSSQHLLPTDSDVPFNSIETLSHKFQLKTSQQPLLSMFAIPISKAPSDSTSTSLHTSITSTASSTESLSPIASPANLLTTSHSLIGTNLGDIAQQPRSMMNTNDLTMFNPSFMMPNSTNFTNSQQTKLNMENDPKIQENQTSSFEPPTSIPRNLFDSLVGYRNLFPSFFPGPSQNLASLSIFNAAGIPNIPNNDPNTVLNNSNLQLANFEQSFEELNQKFVHQRTTTHQLQNALHNICAGDNNAWYGIGNELIRSNMNRTNEKNE